MSHCLEYVWIDGYGTYRSKTKVMKSADSVEEYLDPIWNYDGSSTNQAAGSDSEVLIRPRVYFPDPFRRLPVEYNSTVSEEKGEWIERCSNRLVLCDTWLPSGEPHPTNTRIKAEEVFKRHESEESMFGIEQEFFLYKDGRPLGFPTTGFPSPQRDYYCGVGASNAFGRDCVEKALDNFLYAGLNITGLNAEVAPGQWEFQVCCKGIEAADQLTILRYILNRTAEEFGYDVVYHPKPVEGDWNGSGCHTNFSTKRMREEGGLEHIMEAIRKLETHHLEHIEAYGIDNKLRLSGHHETAHWSKFSYGVANRGASIRIPRSTEADGCGYFEDRRPASNMDPYVVTSKILQTVMLSEESAE